MTGFVDIQCSNCGRIDRVSYRDAEIVKSLESLLDKMRAYESLQASIGKGLVEDIISMYNRQKAEIEELRADNNYLFETMSHMKTEAIKEFWEKVKQKFQSIKYFPPSAYLIGDKILKEMGAKK